MKRLPLAALLAGLLSCDDPSAPLPPADARWVEVVAGNGHSCGRTDDGRVFCWGDNDDGELGTGDTGPRAQPVQGDLRGDASRLLATDGPTCARSDGGYLCWPLGESEPSPAGVDHGHRWAALEAGLDRICAIDGQAIGWCWGRNWAGWLGVGDTALRVDEPRRIEGDQRWRSLTVRADATCGIDTDGSGFCWGRNEGGRLGVGDEQARNAPSPIALDVAWRTISLGHDFACGVTTADALYCWGDNKSGQLGVPANDGSPVPVRVELDDVRTVLAGSGHACAITLDDELHCWGRNTYGAVGDGSTDDAPSPRAIGTGWLQVAAGAAHTCAIDHDRHVWCWGLNDHRQIGDGTIDDRVQPVRVLFPD